MSKQTSPVSEGLGRSEWQHQGSEQGWEPRDHLSWADEPAGLEHPLPGHSERQGTEVPRSPLAGKASAWCPKPHLTSAWRLRPGSPRPAHGLRVPATMPANLKRRIMHTSLSWRVTAQSLPFLWVLGAPPPGETGPRGEGCQRLHALPPGAGGHGPSGASAASAVRTAARGVSWRVYPLLAHPAPDTATPPVSATALASTQRGSPTTAVRQGERRQGRAEACLHCSRTTSQQEPAPKSTQPLPAARPPALLSHSRDAHPTPFRSPHPIHGAGGREGLVGPHAHPRARTSRGHQILGARTPRLRTKTPESLSQPVQSSISRV